MVGSDKAFSGEPVRPETPVDLDQRLAFLGLTADDAIRARELLPFFEKYCDEFVERFYKHLFAFPATERFLQDPVLVARLKEALRQHLVTMLEADWNDSYLQQRLEVGNRHAEIGIQPEFFLGAYNQYIQHCFRAFAPDMSPELRAFFEQILSVLKIVLFDIGLTLDAYFQQSTRTMRDALDMLWKANTELRNFAQLTSHDLKTPLATVANLCDEALDEFRSEMPTGACELVESAKQRTLRMAKMIDELLAESAGPELVDSNDVVSSEEALDEALDRLEPLMQSRGIKIEVKRPLPMVWGNKVRLRESFYNLLSNAAKFTDTQNGLVRVQAQSHPEGCLFVVEDNGPGIPPDELERVFAPFRRLAAHRDRPGSGLGLYFTKNLIEQQDGRIWVESELGQGSKFYVLLQSPPCATASL